jgi:hypothetical protein
VKEKCEIDWRHADVFNFTPWIKITKKHFEHLSENFLNIGGIITSSADNLSQPSYFW